MIGAPDDFELAQARTIFLEPWPGPKPGDDRIEEAAEREDGNSQLLSERRKVGVRDQAQPVLGSLQVQLGAAADEFLNGAKGFG